MTIYERALMLVYRTRPMSTPDAVEETIKVLLEVHKMGQDAALDRARQAFIELQPIGSDLPHLEDFR